MPDPIVDKWQAAIDAPLRPGNRVDYLIDGWATFDAMEKAIQTTLTGDTAGYYIFLAGWWIDEDMPLKAGDSSSSLLSLIGLAAGKGVQVRILVYKNLLKSLFQVLIARRGLTPAKQVAAFNAIPGVQAVLDGYTVGLWQSHHQKVLLVRGAEGPLGFCGGIDIARDRVEPVKRHPGSPYHDVHCRIAGPAVRDLMDVFRQRWKAHPETSQIDAKTALRGGADGRPGSKDEKGPGGASVAVLRTYVSPKGPCSLELSVKSSLLKAIRAARRFIYVEDQYMINTECAEAIGKALKNLQFVIFLVPHSAISDLPRAWSARHAFIEKVREFAGETDFLKFRVFYKLASTPPDLPRRSLPLQPRVAADWPNAEDFGAHTYVHAKVWIFDDELAVIGSPNCNHRGWDFDSEVAVAVVDVKSRLIKGVYSFAQTLRMALWREHLQVDENAVRDPLGWANVWIKQGYADFEPEGKNGPYLRHYTDQSGDDAENSGGWLFADPARPKSADGADWNTDTVDISSSDFESQWQHIIDPTLTPYKPCPRN
jgi:phosphatidylserine/phosphatidylglycerophosphate/cardiolipin synthase-like enzyme